MFEKLAQEFATLFVIISPPAILPVFLAITANLGREARRHVALRCCLIAGTILLLFLALGQLVLLSMGVKLAAFRMAGALILLIFGLRMVLGEGSQGAPQQGGTQDIAVFPLAMPLIAGGGSISAIVTMTDHDTASLSHRFVTALVLVAVMVCVYLSLRFSEAIHRVLGDSGINIAGRIMGLILAALATQIIFEVLQPLLGAAA